MAFHTQDDVGQIAFNGAATELLAVVQRNQLEAHVFRIPASGGGAKPVTQVRRIGDGMRKNLGLADCEIAHGSYDRMTKFVGPGVSIGSNDPRRQ